MARILIVDDESHIRLLYSSELEDDGHKVKTVKGGHGLLRVINDFGPDVLVLDIKLVGFNGLDLLTDIRARKPELPIILCTAYDTFKSDLRTMAADYYVVKSFDLCNLKRKIAMALESQRSMGAAALQSRIAG